MEKKQVFLESEKPKSIEEVISKKKKIQLPNIGEKFMLNGKEYKVIFINEGRNRFSCEPCEGLY